jgi:hypothetical protein
MVDAMIPGTFDELSIASGTPALSLRLAVVWVAVGIFGGLVGRASMRRQGRRVLAISLVAMALCQVVIAGLNRLLGQGDALWRVELAASGGRARGTYVNPDHMAFLLLLALPLVAAWFAWTIRSGVSERSSRRAIGAAALAATWVVIFIMLVASGSRVAFVVAALSSTVQCLAHVGRYGWRWRAAVVALALSTLLVPLAQAVRSEGSSLFRLAESHRYELRFNQRWTVYAGAAQIFLDHPLGGAGLGAFRESFSEIQPADLGRDWWHAHSDPLELLADVGLVGALPMWIAWGAVLIGLVSARGKWVRSEDRLLGEALVLALVGGAVHACFDFPLANPANALAYLTLCGLAVGLIGTTDGSRREE